MEQSVPVVAVLQPSYQKRRGRWGRGEGSEGLEGEGRKVRVRERRKSK